MLVAIMEQMASLTESLEVEPAIIGGVMIEVSGRQHDLGYAHELRIIGRDYQLPATVAPSAQILVEPASVAEVVNFKTVRPPAYLAASFGALEVDDRRELHPIDG